LQPIAMALDDRGRVWVAEAYEYPIRAKGDKGRDRILIFEDTDGDGTLDSRKIFAEGLNLVSGMEVGFGGVWVGAAPYLLFIPDRNADDRADGEPEILLDGWGLHDTHETLNAFIWGPDGWLYGCHGVNRSTQGFGDTIQRDTNSKSSRMAPAIHGVSISMIGAKRSSPLASFPTSTTSSKVPDTNDKPVNTSIHIPTMTSRQSRIIGTMWAPTHTAATVNQMLPGAVMLTPVQ
jgi:putative membrane-bound dehydrogenase-like protein